MSVEVHFEDEGLRDLVHRLKVLEAHVLTIGIQGADGVQRYQSGISVATVGSIQEFGTGANSVHAGIPMRSFLRSTMFEQRVRIEKTMAEAVQATVNGRDPIGAMVNAGHAVAGLVVQQIKRSKTWAKKNAPSTVEKKGFDWPLHASTDGFERLARSISWAIRSLSPTGPILRQGK